MIAAFVAFVGLLVSGLGGLVGDFASFEQIPPGSSARIDLESGDYLVYVGEGGTASTSITMVGDSGPVVLSPLASATKVTVGDFSGYAKYSLTIDTPGSFEVTNDGQTVAVVAPPVAGKIVRTILLPFGVGGLLGLSGLVILVTTIIRRNKAKKQLAANQYPNTWNQTPAPPR